MQLGHKNGCHYSLIADFNLDGVSDILQVKDPSAGDGTCGTDRYAKLHAQSGEVIGWVGSTGKSTGPHCHYEVHKNGNKIDPVYFFYNDLTPEQYDQVLKLAKAANQSFD